MLAAEARRETVMTGGCSTKRMRPGGESSVLVSRAASTALSVWVWMANASAYGTVPRLVTGGGVGCGRGLVMGMGGDRGGKEMNLWGVWARALGLLLGVGVAGGARRSGG